MMWKPLRHLSCVLAVVMVAVPAQAAAHADPGSDGYYQPYSNDFTGMAGAWTAQEDGPQQYSGEAIEWDVPLTMKNGIMRGLGSLESSDPALLNLIHQSQTMDGGMAQTLGDPQLVKSGYVWVDLDVRGTGFLGGLWDRGAGFGKAAHHRFDHWLKGIDNVVQNLGPILEKMPGAQGWQRISQLPRPGMTNRRLYLSDEISGTAYRSQHDGSLSASVPGGSTELTVNVGLASLCSESTNTQFIGMTGIVMECAQDERPHEIDGLTFTSPPVRCRP
jgi:predicted acyl esterase